MTFLNPVVSTTTATPEQNQAAQETFDQLKMKIDKLFSKTKGQLFFKQNAGLLGGLLAKLNFTWTTDMPTAAISATTLYWNPHFFDRIDPDTRVTVLAHELWHNVCLHGLRMGSRDPSLWNEAGDHMINLQLKADGFYMDGFPYLMDPKYIGWTTDDIYADLEKEQQQLPISGTFGVSTDGSEDDPSKNYKENSLSGDVLPVKDEEKYKAVTDVIGAMASARMGGKSAGTVPGEVQLFIDEFLNPKLPWFILLERFFNALCEHERSYARLNRRISDPIMPSLTGRNGLEHLIFAVDASGSVNDEQVAAMNTEVAFIQNELRPEKLTLLIFDTEIQEVYEFERDEPFDQIVITGRGGTDLEDVFDYASRHDATALCVFTDMWVDIPDQPAFPVLWVCTDNPEFDGIPYGQLIRLDTTKTRD